MAYITALLIINAPASALNNASSEGSREDNIVKVKYIEPRNGVYYPYITAQAYRRWLRETLVADPQGWKMSFIYHEDDKNLAYPDANPIIYWDDDLFGYMRAQSGGAESEKKRKQSKIYEQMTPVELADEKKLKYKTLTRISPFRVSTFVSIARVNITDDFGTMSRQEGTPTIFQHQFYHANFQGLLSLDLANAGTFSYSQRTGFQNLDSIRIQQAKDNGLEHLPDRLAYRLPVDERLKRVRRLVEAIPLVQGGAKQTLHYTDTTPVMTIAAVTRYGNHPFNFLVDEKNGQVVFNTEAFARTLYSVGSQLLSRVYIGWKPGFAPDQEAKLEELPDDIQQGLVTGTPLDIYQRLSEELAQNPDWLD